MSATLATSDRTTRTRIVRLARHSRHCPDSLDCRHIFDSLYYVFLSKKRNNVAVDKDGRSAKMRQDQEVGQKVIVMQPKN